MALPWYVDTRLQFYRRDLFARAGYGAPPSKCEEIMPLHQDREKRGTAIQAAIQADAAAAAPYLRRCPDYPENLSAQLQVHQRRGAVLMVDGEPVDALNPWHTCVRRELGRIEYPSTLAPVKARVRFVLR